MSNYQMGAFEALQWAWHMLRNYKDSPGGVDDARQAIQQVLANMGRGDEVNFREETPNTALPL